MIQSLAYIGSGLVVLGAFSWIVARKSMLTRIIASVCVLSLLTFVAYSVGRISQKMVFLGSHIRSFEQYSETLTRLAREGRLNDLSEAVIWFDERWRTDTQSSSNIVVLASDLEKKYGRL